MPIRILTIFAFIPLCPLVVLCQDDEGSAQEHPIEVWQCMAGWNRGDTVLYTVLTEHRAFQNGKITDKKPNNSRVRISVVDSSEAGYVLNWQWLIAEPDGAQIDTGDSALIELTRALSTLDLTVRTGPNGRLTEVDDPERALISFVDKLEWYTKKHDAQLDEPMRERIALLSTMFRTNTALFSAGLFTSIDLFFRPFGTEVLSDSFYVAPYEIRNQLTGEPVPGLIRVELKDVNDINYHVETSFLPDREKMNVQVREALNSANKANGTKRLSMKKVRSMGLNVERKEQFVIQTDKGWPKHIHSLVVSEAQGNQQEFEHTIARDVYAGQPKNLLYYDHRITKDPSDPQNYVERAKILIDRGDLQGAEEDLTMALEIAPTKERLHRRAWVRIELQRDDSALKDLDRALVLDSMDVYAVNLRTKALMNLHRFQEALANAERSMRILPDEQRAMIDAAKTLVAMYRYPEAITLYDRVLAKDTTDWNAYGLRADAYKYLHTADGDSSARADIARSLAIKPNNYSALLSLGNMEMDRGRYDIAITVFDSILAQGPDMTALHNRGYANVQAGRLDEGIKDLEDALDLDPGHAYAPNNLGWAYHLRGEHAKALIWIDKGIQRQPTNSYAYYNKGRVLLTLERNEEACEALREAERLGFSTGYGNAVRSLLEEYCGS